VSVWTGPDTPIITNEMAHDLALEQKVCVRPLVRRVQDRQTGTEDVVAIPCGSTREAVCPSCAHKARVLRMQQCAEGWHRTSEPENHMAATDDDDQVDDAEHDSGRRVRSTRRRQDVPDLPRVPMESRTVGEVFRSAEGREYRPSMFLTFTLPSYGPVTVSGAPRDPGSYDYRRAALDALHFPKLVDRLWQNLRRCAGYRVQYFAAIEAQRRLAPHLHAAMRGVITRQLLRQVVAGTYVQLWWPPFDQAVYVDRLPVWTADCYVDGDTGEVLPTWEQSLDRLDADPEASPAHVLRFGVQLDAKGPDRAVGERRPRRPVSDQVPSQEPLRHLHRQQRRPGVSGAHRSAARRGALAALHARMCELAALRHPTRPPRRRPHPRPVQL
jgi:hypothetical protein